MHEDGHALSFGQGEDVLADGVETLAEEQAVFGAGRTVGEVGRGSGLAVGLVEEDGGGGALVACVARVVDAEVGGDAIEPGAEAGLGAVGLARAVDAQEDLLGKLLGDGLVVHHAVHEVDDRPAVLLDEEVEAGHISGAQLQHDGGVFHLGKVRGALRDRGRKHTIEQARVDGQCCHIFRNPIFVVRLRGGGKIRMNFAVGPVAGHVVR